MSPGMDEHGRRPEPTLPDPGRIPANGGRPPHVRTESDDPEAPDLKAVATAYSVLAFLAVVVIGVWCTWHDGDHRTGIEVQVTLTWMWLGLFPAAALWLCVLVTA